MPNAGAYITKTLGLDYEPKTLSGGVAKVAGGVVPLPFASTEKLAQMGTKSADSMAGKEEKSCRGPRRRGRRDGTGDMTERGRDGEGTWVGKGRHGVGDVT